MNALYLPSPMKWERDQGIRFQENWDEEIRTLKTWEQETGHQETKAQDSMEETEAAEARYSNKHSS